MTERYICVHGHFYQPPRENPWLEAVEIQDSAAPYHDWNVRITAECYAPNGASRVLDGDRRILAITNNYAQISFNIGPTLLAWLEHGAPEAYARILEADRDSRAQHAGHGNALAQVYNHMILPLANHRDKHTQVLWGIADFRHRFGRDPEGMWLPETAVDTETLETLAAHGIAFTVLAPHQAARVRPRGATEWSDVPGERVDPRRPYLCVLPSGRSITLFFYDGPASRAIAFEGLLNNGEAFAERLAGGFTGEPAPQLVHVATDGESYGHHHAFGEMALTYALRVIQERQLGRLTNYGEHLAMFPPRYEAEIIERTSWSCAHGIERWRANCGCRAGHPGWNQAWRGPLRAALDWLRDELAPLFEREGARLLKDPWAARDAYIDVILDRAPERTEAFLAAHGRSGGDADDRLHTLQLLEMQRHAMLMYTSCGWFFDELSGIETVQVIKYAARALQLAERFGARLEDEFIRRLAEAKSNLRQWGDGAGVYRRAVKRSIVTLPRVVAHYGISSLFEPYETPDTSLFSYTVHHRDGRREVSGGHVLGAELVTVTSHVTGETADAAYAALHLGGHDLQCGVRLGATEAWFEETKQELVEAFQGQGASAALRTLDARFGRGLFGLADLFVEERRKILSLLTEDRLGRFEGVYRELYEESRPLIAFMRDSEIPIPPAFLMAAQYTLTRALAHEIRRAVDEPLGDRAFELAGDLDALGLVAEWREAEALLRQVLEARAEGLAHDPLGPPLAQTHRLLDLADALGVTVNLWQVQNFYDVAATRHRDLLADSPAATEAEDRAALAAEFRRLGSRLNFNLDAVLASAQTPP
jgi:alpha-amylase/alpha-mannosidase (GH57 family)